MVNQPSLQSDRESPRILTSLQDHFLEKLTYLLQRRSGYLAEANHDATLVKVLDRAIYVTYLDCLSQGVAEEARVRVDQYRDLDPPNTPSPN